jgi:hypothetical protein
MRKIVAVCAADANAKGWGSIVAKGRSDRSLVRPLPGRCRTRDVARKKDPSRRERYE